MLPSLECSQNVCERLKVGCLDDERMLLEERNDAIPQVRAPADCEGQHVAAGTLAADCAAAEESDECFEHRSMRLVLLHLEHRLELPVSRGSDERVPMEADTEAAFTVDESDDPLRIELEKLSGFLLI